MSPELSNLLVDLEPGSPVLPATVLAGVPAGIAVTSLAGSLVFANDSFREIFEIGTDVCMRSADIRKLTRGLLSEEFLLSVAREDGQRQRRVCFGTELGQRELQCTATRIKHGGFPIYLTVVVQDISEVTAAHRKQLQTLTHLVEAQRAADSGSLADTLLEHMEMPVMLMDRRCRYRYFNPQYAALVKSANGSVPQVGEPVLHSVIDPVRRRLLADVLARVAQGEPRVFESEFRDERGEVSRWIDFHFKPIEDASGRVDGAMGLGCDVSPLKRANLRHQYLNAELRLRLERRAAKIDAANRDLSNRVAHACDTLRSDLQVLRSSLDALKRPGQQPLAALASMETCIDGLSRLADVGVRIPERRSVDMNRLVREARRDLALLLEGRSIEFDVDRLPNVFADPVLLRQVLHNLLSNAIKATRGCQAARIRIWTTIEEGTTVWSIADNGVGFDMKDADVMFSAFARHGVKSRGVGLSVAWRAIQQLNGRLWCESSPGCGATFHFVLGYQDEGT